MGCHTWFFKKVERSIEEARELYLTKSEKIIKTWKTIEKIPSDVWTPESIAWNIKVLERQMKVVEKELCDAAVMNKQPGDSSCYIKGKGFYIQDYSLPHDLFRVGGYPEDRLFSLEDTMFFIENNDIQRYDSVGITDFWERFPDGMI